MAVPAFRRPAPIHSASTGSPKSSVATAVCDAEFTSRDLICWLTKAAERWTSSQRTKARAKTSPVCQVETGMCVKR